MLCPFSYLLFIITLVCAVPLQDSRIRWGPMSGSGCEELLTVRLRQPDSPARLYRTFVELNTHPTARENSSNQGAR